MWNVDGDRNEFWRRMATCVKIIAKEIVDETKSSLQKTRKRGGVMRRFRK